jgi:hypothetical protein
MNSPDKEWQRPSFEEYVNVIPPDSLINANQRVYPENPAVMQIPVDLTFHISEIPEPALNITGNGGEQRVVFNLDGKEYLKICPDGKFVVKGRIVTTDAEVYRAFVEWLNGVRAPAEPIHPKPINPDQISKFSRYDAALGKNKGDKNERE